MDSEVGRISSATQSTPVKKNDTYSNSGNSNRFRYMYILPVLFLEYLAIALTRSLLPSMIVNEFNDYAYFVIGIIETTKGLLAMIACPFWGKISDRIGRKTCLLITVIGSTMPFCMLAFTSNMYIYSFLLAISGIFAATFPIVFAYISDSVSGKRMAPAYGLALATFGLSFCIGPILTNIIGQQYIFRISFLLLFLDILYIIFVLPETLKPSHTYNKEMQSLSIKDSMLLVYELIPRKFQISDSFRVFNKDLYMSNLAVIVFLYYTSVWAIVSTLMVYVTRTLKFSPQVLGALLSSYGMSTMLSEGILVRIIVPSLGEILSIKIGLIGFSIQCIIISFSTTSSTIFASVIFSMLSNLVYPSVSSLVSKLVTNDEQGEALGALNGIKALTEGFGPLSFGLLMSFFENTSFPGAPYLVASLLSFISFTLVFRLPSEPEILSKKGNGVLGDDDDDDGSNDSDLTPLNK